MLRHSKPSLLTCFMFIITVTLSPAVKNCKAEPFGQADYLAPIILSNQHLLAAQHLSFLPPDVERLPAGTYNLLLNGSISNTMNRKPEVYLLDAETRGLDLKLSYGLSEQWQLTILQAGSWRGGGGSDQLIDEWHKFFNFPRGDRSRVPEDKFFITGETKDRGSFDIEREAFGFFAPEFALSWLKEITVNQALGLSLRTRLPGGTSGRDISGFDTAAEIFYRYLSDRRQIFASLSAANYQDVEESAVRYAANQFLFTTGISQQFSEYFVAYIALLGGTKFIENIDQYPDYQIYLDVGGRLPIFKNYSLELMLREDPAPSDATADVTFSLGLNARF